MKITLPRFISFRIWALILGGFFFAVFTGFYFFNVVAKTEDEKTFPQQNLVLGRLAYGSSRGPFAATIWSINTANADGTDRSVITSAEFIRSSPSWSPDGSRMVLQGEVDIYLMNADGSNLINLTNTAGIGEAEPSWSVTGKIAYTRGGQIWTMNPDGTNQMPVPGITRPAPNNAPVWSPDGGKIAFHSNDGEIWTINADGTNEQRVTNNTSLDMKPDWSPDGTKIVFEKWPGGSNGISVINADGTNETQLTSTVPDSYRSPAWSPDGTAIAFSRDGASGGLFVMDATGGNETRIIPYTPETGSHSNPAWNPIARSPSIFTISGRITNGSIGLGGVAVNLGGTTQAVTTTDAMGNYQFPGLAQSGNYTVSPSFLNHGFTPTNRSFNNLISNQTADFSAFGICGVSNCIQNGRIAYVLNSEIFTMNPDGSDQVNITNNPASDTSPNYSPDGSKIIFSTNRDGNSEIYRMNSDGSSPIRLTNNPASETSPAYSPDGNSILFISNRDGNGEIYKMNSDGTNQVRLTNDAANQTVPRFSPDGQKIIFVTNLNQLWVMNANGTNPQQFPDPAGSSHSYDSPSYSPNGQKIIFFYGSSLSPPTAWTMNADGTNRAKLPFNIGTSPRYSPDGTKICSTGPIFFSIGVFTSNADGRNTLGIISGNAGLADWQPILLPGLAPRRTAFDFDGDGRSDISAFRPAEGFWYLLRSSAGFSARQWGIPSDIIAPGDYDGDLKTDIAVWRPANGNFYILNSFDNTLRTENLGLAGDIPTGGDWDGDGKADAAVYRAGAQSFFYYRASMGNPQRNITFLQWGISGDKPVAGDYDGDGLTDAAVYRNGTWYTRQSFSGQLSAISFGLASDVIIPADYDADGKTDQAVYRGGIWYLLRSAQGFSAFQFGISSDIPVPADYDGDGRADAAIYRNGVWWILKTQSGAAEAVSFGVSSDKPVPAAFVR